MVYQFIDKAQVCLCATLKTCEGSMPFQATSSSADKVTWLCVSFAGSTALQLKDVNIACRLSSRIAVLGVNGAGKSTLIKIITGEEMRYCLLVMVLVVPEAGASVAAAGFMSVNCWLHELELQQALYAMPMP